VGWFHDPHSDGCSNFPARLSATFCEIVKADSYYCAVALRLQAGGGSDDAAPLCGVSPLTTHTLQLQHLTSTPQQCSRAPIDTSSVWPCLLCCRPLFLFAHGESLQRLEQTSDRASTSRITPSCIVAARLTTLSEARKSAQRRVTAELHRVPSRGVQRAAISCSCRRRHSICLSFFWRAQQVVQRAASI
jgi:hypothetical protein